MIAQCFSRPLSLVYTFLCFLPYPLLLHLMQYIRLFFEAWFRRTVHHSDPSISGAWLVCLLLPSCAPLRMKPFIGCQPSRVSGIMNGSRQRLSKVPFNNHQIGTNNDDNNKYTHTHTHTHTHKHEWKGTRTGTRSVTRSITRKLRKHTQAHISLSHNNACDTPAAAAAANKLIEQMWWRRRDGGGDTRACHLSNG